MDNKTLRALIIDYKDSGMAYQEIANKLAEEHNIVRSRQAIQGMYTRAMKRRDSEVDKERLIRVADAVNIFCLGYNRTEVRELMNSLGYNVNYNDVVLDIRENTGYIQEIEQSIIDKVREILVDKPSLEEISRIIEYKGIKPTDKKLKQYIKRAYTMIAEDKVYEVLVEAYKFTEEAAVTREIASEFNVKHNLTRIKDKI